MINTYVIASLVSFLLFFMGSASFIRGLTIYLNYDSKSGRYMFATCVCVFFWDLGYGWMGLCYDSDFAYIPRAIALYSIIVFLYCLIKFLANVSNTTFKKYNLCLYVLIVAYTISWFNIITKKTVTFELTPWGYWYVASMSWARMLQFSVVILGVALYYVILLDWRKRATLARNKVLIKRFSWFGPIIVAGYTLDTLIPLVFHTPAIPGSAIAACADAMLLCAIANKTRSFGISINNVAEYVFKEVLVPVLVVDTNNQIVLANSYASRLLTDPDTNKLIGLPLNDLLSPLDNMDADFPDQLGRARRIRNTEVLCRVDEYVINDDFNEEMCRIVFLPDITASYKAMTYARESKRIAEEASQSKSNFLANMSHEIRTPMNAIIGMSDILLRDNDLSEENKAQLQNIKDAGDGLLGIINDILDISKIESGKYELVDIDYDFPSIIHDVSTIINVKLSETPVELKLSIDPDIATDLHGDELRIRQILLNILGNAVKFTKKGSICLNCSQSLDDDKEHVTLYFDIKDSGIGIKPEDIDKIFGSFNQVDTRKNRLIQGTGLGLTISQNLARLMGGDITVESTYGEGSTFHVSVRQKVRSYRPLGSDVVKSLESMKYRTAKAESMTEIIPRPDKKVLIVDDSKVNLVVAKGLMKPYQMTIDTASCGAEAIDKVQANDYDVVFMDHMMPELDGLDATKIIRNLGDDKYKNLIIIALTANAVAGTKEMLIAEGMNDFLAKPIDKIELNNIIEKWL